MISSSSEITCCSSFSAGQAVSNFPSAVRYLDSFINFEKGMPASGTINFRLTRMKKLLALLGEPQRKLKVAHIAGTKGKGSTAAFLAEILRQAGYTVGLYTSPHLVDFRERIRILRPRNKKRAHARMLTGCISEKDFVRVLAEMVPPIETIRRTPRWGELTYFEVLTALAFVYFKEQNVDFVVLETGLGGRLDATNVANPLVCGITAISLDHTAILGNSLAAIAREKAAIIKRKGVRVVVGGQPKEALAVIRRRCQRFRAKTVYLGEDILVQEEKVSWQAQLFCVRTSQHEYELETPLLGRYQLENASVAIGMAEALRAQGFVILDAAIRKGIAQVFWPGRFEILRRRPCVVLDGAHNPDSMRRLAETACAFFRDRKVYLILGVSADKDWQGICQAIFPVGYEVILTQASHPRALVWNKKTVASLAQGKKVFYADHTMAAVRYAQKKARPQDVILVTGSFFLVGEAREILRESGTLPLRGLPSCVSLRGAKQRGNLDDKKDCFTPSGFAMTLESSHLTQVCRGKKCVGS